MEQDLDDRDVSHIFYHFVHEWNQEESGSCSPSLQSQYTSSPRSPLMQLGDTTGDVLGQASREHGHFSTSPLSRESMLPLHHLDGVPHDTDERDMST